jgi:alcohol dehydrogenase class IV
MYDIINIKKIVAGPGAIDALGREVKNLQVEKVLIVTDKGVVNAGVVDKALKPLKKEGVKFEIFDEIEPNPKDTTVEKGAQYLRDTNAEAVIGIGGGSSMDAAKVIAALSCNKGSVDAARLSIEGTRELLNDLNIAEDIKSMGVTEESISVLAELAMKDNCTSNNPRSINTEGYKQLYYKLYSRD